MPSGRESSSCSTRGTRKICKISLLCTNVSKWRRKNVLFRNTWPQSQISSMTGSSSLLHTCLMYFTVQSCKRWSPLLRFNFHCMRSLHLSYPAVSLFKQPNCIMKRKLKQRWSSMPQNQQKGTITSHFKWTHRTEKKTTTYMVGNQDPDLGQAHKCGGVTPDNEIATLSSWLVFFGLFIVTGWNIVFTIELWQSSLYQLETNSLPVHRKYRDGQTRENSIYLLS